MKYLMRRQTKVGGGKERSSSGSRQVTVIPHRDETGFTLIEVLIAFVVLMVVMVPLGYVLVAQVGSAAMSKQRLTAIGLGEKWVETLSNATPPANPSGGGGPQTGTLNPPIGPSGAVPSQTVSGTTYIFDVEYTWAAAGGTPDLCSSGVPQVLDLQVWVYWDGTRHFVTDNTLIDYPPHGVQTLGFLAVQLTNSTTVSDNLGNPYSKRVQSVPVTITGPSTAPTTVVLYPDQYGCVFTEVSPGSYTVSIADPITGTPPASTYGSPPFVANLLVNNSQPTSPPATSVTVVIGQTSLVQYQYDEGTPVTASYSVAGAPVTVVGIPLTVYSANLKPSSYWNIVTAAAAAAAGASTTTPLAPSGNGLYPFAAGYSIFAGDCPAESTPEGVVPITTAPGIPASVTVPLAGVTVTVTLNGAPVVGASVALAAITSGLGCSANTYQFPLTNSSGQSVSDIPFGLYTASATGPVGGITGSTSVDATSSATAISVVL